MRLSSASWLSLLVVTTPLVAAYPFLLDPRDGLSQADWSWVKSYAALGDSYAAGIGVGNLESASDATECSRYDGGYPRKVQSVVSAENFQFVACSGDVSKDVVQKQGFKLQNTDPIRNEKKFDLITVSAGGNDVGFSNVLENCLFLPFSDEKCNDALKKAEDIIDNQLEQNIYSMLGFLDKIRAPFGIIVQTLYGKFFSEDPEPCNKQRWCLLSLTENSCRTVDVEMRKEFNRLVGKTNAKIYDTIAKFNAGSPKPRVYAAHWGASVIAGAGQLCQSGSSDRFDDPSNIGLSFIRPNVEQHMWTGERRTLDAGNDFDNETDSALVERNINMHSWKRLPDTILMNFHPTQIGTWYQASAALEAADTAWLTLNDVSGSEDTETCEWDGAGAEEKEEVGCYDPGHGSANPSSCYIERDAMISHAEKFCEQVGGLDNANLQKGFDTDTENGSQLFVSSDRKISKENCEKRTKRIIDGCVPNSNNPLNFKYGGQLRIGTSYFQINVDGGKSCHRPVGDGDAPMQERPKPEPKEEVSCYDPGKGSANPPSCYISRDAMWSHANDFCDNLGKLDKAELEKSYKTDTYNGAHISSKSDKKVSKDECVTRIGHMIDGCTPNSNNPMNFKYGGSVTYDGTTYKINVDGGRSCQHTVGSNDAPLEKSKAHCDFFNKAVTNEFWVYGAGFLDDDFGNEFSNQLAHCQGSKPSGWMFNYFEKPDNSGFHWQMKFNTPVGQAPCVRAAINGAGGGEIGCDYKS